LGFRGADLRLGDRRFELLPVQGAGEVEEHAGRRGHRDPAVDGRLVVRERDPACMQARAIDAARRDDVGCGASRLADAPERRGGVMAQDSTRPGGQDGGHPCAGARHERVADGVHAGVQRMQPGERDTPVDDVSAEPQRE